MKELHRFPIGTMYRPIGKNTQVCTVVDQMTVINSRGEIVKTYYKSAHTFLGQQVSEDVGDATIARGIANLKVGDLQFGDSDTVDPSILKARVEAYKAHLLKAEWNKTTYK